MKLRLIPLTFTLSLAALQVSAFAKEIKLQWEEIEDSASYEIEIVPEAGGKNRTIKLKGTRWKGDVDYGVYLYRVRGVDKARRPGDWSDAVPLVVLPPAPEPLEPGDDSKLEISEKNQSKIFKWTKTPATDEYRVRVFQGESEVLTRTTRETRIDLSDLAPGSYTWSVQAIVKPTLQRGIAALSGKQWESPASSSRDIEVAFVTMTEPEPLGPVGDVVPSPTGILRFDWKKVQHAKVYEVTLEKEPAPGVPVKPRVFKVTQNFMSTKVQDFGTYRWRVRALASATTLDTVTSESKATFDLGPSDSSGGRGYVGLSGLYAPYQYGVITPTGKGALDSQAVTLRLTGESWLSKGWGVGGGAQNTFVTVSGSGFTWLDWEVYGKYYLKIRALKSFALVPKLGLENRQYLFVAADVNNSGTGPALSSQKVGVIGPSLGIDLRKQFDEHWSLGVKLTYFKPVILGSSPSGASLGPNSMISNVSAGIQGFYWYSKRWGTGLGAFIDRRSLNIQTPSGQSEVNLNATHLFGSVLFKL